MARVRLYRAKGPADAYLLRAWLAQRGIAAVVRGEARMGLAGAIPVRDALPEVWVAEEELERAREALEGFRAPTLVHPEWACPACGESNPPGFEVCWSCEAERPG